MRLLVVGAIVLAGLVPLFTEPPVAANARVAPVPRTTDEIVQGVAFSSEPSTTTAPARSLDFACSTSFSAITPCAGAQNASMNAAGSVTFTVQNKTIEPVSYQLTCGKTGVVTTCSAPGNVAVSGNSTKTVSVSWTTGGSAGSGTLSLTADDASTPVTGAVVFTVAAPTATPLYVDQVSPHLQRHLVDSGQADTARFVLRNVGEDSTGWSWSVACSGNAIIGNTCTNTSGTVGLGVGAQTTVAVAYTISGANNALGQVLLRQWRTGQDSVRDSGFVEVQIARNDSLVQISQQNPGESNAPDQCVTVSVARGLAAECGALRAVHAFPSLRTYGKVRAPVLLYNSQQAHPRPVIRLDVTLPDARIPDSVVAIAYDSSGAPISGARGNWTGNQWRARSTRRVAVTWDGLAWPSGLHRYSVDVRRWYAGSGELSPVTGTFMLVNRSGSAFGAGWWVAGLERILNPDGILRWTGGDGATRRYTSVASNTWVAPALDRRDTIVLVGTSYYERRLAHGLRVRYDYTNGLHIATVNRLGHVTRFVYSGGSSRLDSIVPPSGVPGYGWALRYDNTSGMLREVEAVGPGLSGRRDSLSTSSGDLIRIKLRSGDSVRFGYDGSSAHRMGRRTDERGVWDTVTYGAADLVASVRVQNSLTDATARDTVKLTPAETRGVAGTAAAPLQGASTLIDGFRTDVADTTAYLVNRWGAPTRVRNAFGDDMQLTRTSANFPALVTALRTPNGRVLVATYDQRGNLDSLRDSATFKAGPVYASTRHTWDQTFDVVTRVINPEGDSAKAGIDASNGNVLWREDGRGSATRTNFLYDATTGLLIRSLSATGVKDTLIYDGGLWNPARSDNVLGQYVTWAQDAQGRVIRTERPMLAGGQTAVDSVVYDVMDRPTLTTRRAGTDTLLVTQTYTKAGQLLQLTKRSANDGLKAKVGSIITNYGYDARNRLVAETLSTFYPLTLTYDPAGNLLSGGRNPWTSTYDALNRPTYRTGGNNNSFVYDEVGNIRVAFNLNARVARRWGMNGTLRTDSLWIAGRKVSDRNFSLNVFGIGARYDLNLRRVAFQHPQTVAPAPDSQRVWFNGSTGFIDSVADILGNRFSFQYDNDARPTYLKRLTQQATVMGESLSYDVVGRLLARVQKTGTTVLHRDTLYYDMGNRVIRANGTSNDLAHYNALGPLDTMSYGAGGQDNYLLDALGLRYQSFGTAVVSGTQQYRFLAGSERMDKSILFTQSPGQLSDDSTFYMYTLGGVRNVETHRKWFYSAGSCQTICPPGFNQREVRENSMPTDAAWRVTGAFYRIDTIPSPGASYKSYSRTESYRYDPLGRRIRKEMIRDMAANVCTTHDKSSGCRNEVTRTVWDGANILYDVRMPSDTMSPTGGDGYPAASDLAGSVGYTNAGGIDAPLSLFKGSTLVVPYTNWRGTFDMGTCPTTVCTEPQAYFPLQNATVWGDAPPPANGPLNWFGEVIGGQTDGSGFQYKRNRFYSAAAGAFTQEDPLGLAGGLSAYGFAAGDPISFDDPFGLRKLTGRERAGAGTLCWQIDCDRINVHEGNDSPEENEDRVHALRGSMGSSITYGDDIYMRNGWAGRFDELAHELGHVWQFHMLYMGDMALYLAAAGPNQLSYFVWSHTWGIFGASEYLDGEDALDGRSFYKYRFNQQADVVALCLSSGAGRRGRACRVSPVRPLP